tara:strand:+ start:38 stop:625 length:588 start_codon:yes stop_codon:yes gene_type:complete
MIPPILQRVRDAGHETFESGAYDLNIIGVRSQGRSAGNFDDWLCVAYKDLNGTWCCHWMEATTDPGIPWLTTPGNERGSAILKSGQYRGVYKLDLHRKKYLALCQRGGVVQVYRDNNRDDVLDLDPDTLHEGMFGINIHRSNLSEDGAYRVGKYSAGCTVVKRAKDFALLIELCEKQIGHHPTWPKTFTYTLLED